MHSALSETNVAPLGYRWMDWIGWISGRGEVKGILYQKKFYHLNLIFWIVMVGGA